jgi:hypothetical protein
MHHHLRRDKGDRMATLSELVTLTLETCTPSERKSLRSAAKQ